jgi:hypothetical protein
MSRTKVFIEPDWSAGRGCAFTLDAREEARLAGGGAGALWETSGPQTSAADRLSPVSSDANTKTHATSFLVQRLPVSLSADVGLTVKV